MTRPGIPVVMYHSVGAPKPGWAWNHLVTPLDVFEGHLRELNLRNWTTISLRQLHDHLSTGSSLPERAVVLTFDDGYLDNYTLAWPLLRKYGHRAVVYASLDFIDPMETPRPTLDDVWEGRCSRVDVPTLGFLSAVEMRRMMASGHVEIQSHARTHTWYPHSGRIVDFHRPPGVEGYSAPPWLGWNEQPQAKYEYLSRDLTEDIPWGMPIYEVRKSLEAPRCKPPMQIKERAIEIVAQGGGATFFEQSNWRQRLLQDLEEPSSIQPLLESDAEFHARVRAELQDSKAGLEELTGHPVDFLCWPGGGRRPETLRFADEVGYLASTTHFCDATRRNIHGQDPRETNRIGSGSPWSWRGKVYHRTPPRLFSAQLDDFAGFSGSRIRLRMAKAQALLANVFRRPMREGLY